MKKSANGTRSQMNMIAKVTVSTMRRRMKWFAQKVTFFTLLPISFFTILEWGMSTGAFWAVVVICFILLPLCCLGLCIGGIVFCCCCRK